MTNLAAERIAALTDEGDPGRVQARLYRAAARVVTNAHEEALQDLRQIDGAGLVERDAELLAAALSMGRNVRKALPPAPADRDDSVAQQTSMRPRVNFSASLAAVDRAQKLLDESAAQLKERTR